MYWENELRCPHCKSIQVDQDEYIMDGWQQHSCEACGEPFKYMEDRSVLYTTKPINGCAETPND